MLKIVGIFGGFLARLLGKYLLCFREVEGLHDSTCVARRLVLFRNILACALTHLILHEYRELLGTGKLASCLVKIDIYWGVLLIGSLKLQKWFDTQSG